MGLCSSWNMLHTLGWRPLHIFCLDYTFPNSQLINFLISFEYFPVTFSIKSIQATALKNCNVFHSLAPSNCFCYSISFENNYMITNHIIYLFMGFIFPLLVKTSYSICVLIPPLLPSPTAQSCPHSSSV